METVEYQGWKNNLRIANGEAELIVTLDVGPRVMRYATPGGPNVFKEYAGQLGRSGEPDWQIRGGHRIWVGPEDLTRTYAADNGPVAWERLGPLSARFIAEPETAYGIQKTIELTLEPKGTRVHVVQHVANIGTTATTLAPWSLSVMAAGGTAVVPLPPHRPHPGLPKNARSAAEYAPNQNVILWPFFDFTDERWRFGSRYILLRQDVRMGPTKIGLAHRLGWTAYHVDGALFVKRFGYEEGKTYPDGGSSFETFTNEDALELEALGPLTTLKPGERAELIEDWDLFANVPRPTDEAAVDRDILPLVTGR